MSRIFKKDQIFILDHYFLFSGDKKYEKEFENFLELSWKSNRREFSISRDFEWFESFKSKEEEILNLIKENLEKSWEISRLPTLEKALLSHSLYEIENNSSDKKKNFFVIINYAIEFSKKYFDAKSYKYINKILDNVVNKKIKAY